MHRLIVPALAVLLTCVAPCRAETLEDAWTMALDTDPGLQAVRLQTGAAESNLAAARSNRLPVVEVEGAFTQLDQSPGIDSDFISLPFAFSTPDIFSSDNFVTAAARISVPLYTSGAISHGVDAAADQVDARMAGESAFIQDLKLAVAESFVAVLRAQSAGSVAAAYVTSLEAHLVDVENLYRKDLVPRNDVLAVTVSLADARQAALRANNALDIARAAYNRRLSRNLDSAVSLEEVMPMVAEPARSDDLEALTATAMASRTEPEILSRGAQALQKQAQVVRARLRPQIAATAGYAYQESDLLRDETFAFAGVGLRWSPFDGGRTRNQSTALAQTADALIEQRDEAVALIRLQVRSAWLDMAESRERLTVTQTATEQAQENLRIARSRYQNGLGTNTEVLDAQALQVLSDSNHNNARYDAALARLRLARAVGVL
ncbi:TolC family protein [Elongatibacter sediminis]|uniref:TolC family protein n=1 Tax=Elongatibacter sediminis TaxID=3119006 RepID=A0AAW9RGM2_9GAMM